jgi:hypothetical protein
MAQVEEDPSTINVDEIITIKNITDNIIIELLKRITLSKNKELESKQQESVSTSSSSGNEVYLNYFYDSDECVDVDSTTINDSRIFLKNIVTCHNYDRL